MNIPEEDLFLEKSREVCCLCESLRKAPTNENNEQLADEIQKLTRECVSLAVQGQNKRHPHPIKERLKEFLVSKGYEYLDHDSIISSEDEVWNSRWTRIIKSWINDIDSSYFLFSEIGKLTTNPEPELVVRKNVNGRNGLWIPTGITLKRSVK